MNNNFDIRAYLKPDQLAKITQKAEIERLLQQEIGLGLTAWHFLQQVGSQYEGGLSPAQEVLAEVIFGLACLALKDDQDSQSLLATVLSFCEEQDLFPNDAYLGPVRNLNNLLYRHRL